MDEMRICLGIAVAVMASTPAGLAQVKDVTIGLIGDSTVAEQSGWGPAFAGRFNEHARVLNRAVNGATLQSLSKRLDALVKLKPDYVLIQFGHNDQKRYGTEVYSEYLKSYVERIRQAGGQPVIVSSVTRRSFDADGRIVSNLVKSEKYTFRATLTAYAQAAQRVAAEGNLPFIDLHALSMAHHNRIGPEASMAYNFKEGDQTHFNRKGGEAITDLILPALQQVVPELAAYIRSNETGHAGASTEQEAAIRTCEGGTMNSTAGKHPDEAAFTQAATAPWREVFADAGTGDWTEQWFLDGEVGTVRTGPGGMILSAGPEFKNDAHHLVLWTKRCFEGDLKIEYDYTRLDDENRCVTILYIQATGSGEAPYAKDIAAWSGLRRVPAMKTYFDHMHTYHLSYAAFDNSGRDRTSYIRGRRYMPGKTGLQGSDLEPDYYVDDLFATGVKHHLTVIKKDRDLFMRVENPEKVTYCHMTNRNLPIITEGRIGLRHMFTRSACYQDIRISTPLTAAVPGDTED